MTPSQIEEQARRRYNSISDNFFTQDEIFFLIYDACQQLARECKIIENLYSTSTVASQQEYAYPSNTIAIKRVTYDGIKLKPINMREDDTVTGLNQSTVAEGTPAYYYVWNEVMYLRPIPSGVGTLKVFSFNEASTISVTSVLEIPSMFHMDLINYVVAEMAAKDSNFNAAEHFLNKWEKSKIEIKRWARKRLVGDSFNAVIDEERTTDNFLGTV